jgi:hypothetical protein
MAVVRYQLELVRKYRALRAQGLKVRVRGWLIEIQGGKHAQSTPSGNPKSKKLPSADLHDGTH